MDSIQTQPHILADRSNSLITLSFSKVKNIDRPHEGHENILIERIKSLLCQNK